MSEPTELHEVDKPAIATGNISMGLKYWGTPTPKTVVAVCTTIQYAFTGLIGLVSAASGKDAIFSSHTACVITFSLSVGIVIVGAIQKTIGLDNTK